LFVVVAAVIRFALNPLLGTTVPYMFFILAVMVAAVRLGTGPAVAATIFGAAAGTFLFVPPRFAFVPFPPDRTPYIIAFLIICAGIVLFARRLDAQRAQLLVREKRVASEAREQRLIDAAQGYAIYELDREGKILTWNKGAERMKGWKAEEIIGQPYTVLHPPESRARNAPNRELAIAAETGRFEEEAVRMRKDGSVFAAHISLFPLRDEHGEVTGFVKLTRDISDRSRAGREILESRRRMEGIVQSAMDAIVTIDESQRVVLFNPAAEKMFGYSADKVLGQPVTMLIPERFRPRHDEYVRRFFDSGVLNRPLGRDGEGDVNALRSSGEEFPVEASISQVTVDGERVGTIILRDITERRTSEEARLLLAREVDHRAKNALAVAQALVTLTRADNVQDFAEAVRGRIAALGRAHSLLSQSHWRGAPLEQLIHDEVSPYAKEGQLSLRGPAINCSASSVQSLSLLFHELATNAVKHGALGHENGNVNIDWILKPDSLAVEWRESGGPPVKEPSGEGFGSRLLRQVSGRQLDAEIEFHWHPAGLRVQIKLPSELFMREVVQASAAELDDGAQEATENRANEYRKILLVEDEELVALELSSELSRLGWAIVGPAATLSEAQALLSDSVDAAVLDVNLRGRPIYPVAEQLEKLHIPFVFCTGYGVVDPEGRFPDVPVIRKPAKPAAVSAALADLLKARSN
jgi:PAS domain S-box-containing protein